MKNKLLAPLVVGSALIAASASAEVVVMNVSTKYTRDVYTNGEFVKNMSSSSTSRSYLVFELDQDGALSGEPTLVYYYSAKGVDNKVVKAYGIQSVGSLNYNIVKKGALTQVFGSVEVDGSYSFTGVASKGGSVRSFKLDPSLSQITSSGPETTPIVDGGDVERFIASGNGTRLMLNKTITTDSAAVAELVKRLERQGYKAESSN